MSRRDCLGLVALLGLWLTVYAVVASIWPWRHGFDDREHLNAALLWRSTLRLSSQELFLRVPLWDVLLGTFVLLFRGAGLFVLQFTLLAGALTCYFVFTADVRAALPEPWGYLPPLLFTLSPQAVLYARHAVNDPLVGLLTMLVLVAGVSPRKSSPLWLGLVCGLAVMTKPVAIWLTIPALAYVLSGSRHAMSRRLVTFAFGTALAVGPFVALHLTQRGFVPIDTTAAYNLSTFTPQQWRDQGDHVQRQRAGMANWRATFADDPTAYLRGFLSRLGRWLVRPSSTDFVLYYKSYPQALIRAWEQIALCALAIAAAPGIRRYTSMWIFMGLIAASCAFPQHMPYTPKLILVYPLLLMAPFGMQEIRGWQRRAANERTDGTLEHEAWRLAIDSAPSNKRNNSRVMRRARARVYGHTGSSYSGRFTFCSNTL